MLEELEQPKEVLLPAGCISVLLGGRGTRRRTSWGVATSSEEKQARPRQAVLLPVSREYLCLQELPRLARPVPGPRLVRPNKHERHVRLPILKHPQNHRLQEDGVAVKPVVVIGQGLQHGGKCIATRNHVQPVTERLQSLSDGLSHAGKHETDPSYRLTTSIP